MPATRLSAQLPSHEAHTAQWVGLKGKNNGELLRVAEVAGYDVLLTVDQGIPHSPTIFPWPETRNHPGSRTNQIEDLLPLVDTILQALETIQPGQTVEIPLLD